MNLAQSFRLALKSIADKKARTFLTMLGIIIGIAAVMILVSLVQGFQRQQMEYYQKQGVNKVNVYAYQWDGDVSQELYEYCQSLREIALGVTPVNEAWGLSVRYGARAGRDTRVLLGSDQLSVCYNYRLARGRDLSYLDIKKSNKVCVLGGAAAEELFNYADPVGRKLRIGSNEFTVIGVYDRVYEKNDEDGGDYYDNVVAVPYTLNRLLMGTNRTEQFIVRAVDGPSTKEVITRVSAFLSRRIDPTTGSYDVYSENTWMEDNDEQTRTMAMVLGGIAGIALLVGGIGIMNIMLVTVTERTREIGIRKAIGARRGSIISQFLIESAVISFLGGLIGILFGTLATLVLGKLLMDAVILPDLGMSLGAAAVSIMIGMIFGSYPAVKASGLQPVEALRAE